MNRSIYIPFEKYHKIGGPATFMKNLQTFFGNRGFLTAESPQNAKVIFFPISFSPKVLDNIRSKGCYIIQRLDGVHYPSKHGEQYLEINRIPKKIYLEYADMVIFQSRYSLAQCFAMFGERDNYQIILNGVDKSLFSPSHSRKNKGIEGKVQFVTTGRFRNIDMIEPVVKALDMLKQAIDFELTVIGPVVNPQLKPYFRRAYIRHIETLPLPEIAEKLRNSDIFLYSHLNPPCPNSVIEAISCGLPVVGFDSGAMAELCFFSKELLVYVSDEVFQKYEDFDTHKLGEKILFAIEHYDHYKALAMCHSDLYSFKECGERYLEVFEGYLKKRRKLVPLITYSPKRIMKKVQQILQKMKTFMLR